MGKAPPRRGGGGAWGQPPETETFGRAFAALRHRRAARDAGRSDDPIEAN